MGACCSGSKRIGLESEATRAVQPSNASWDQLVRDATAPILPLTLKAETVDSVAAHKLDAKKRAWIASRARAEYKEACQIFELILVSVCFDNVGVLWVVNEMRDRMVRCVREAAELDLKHMSPGTAPPNYVQDKLVSTFGGTDEGGFAAFGDSEEAVMALMEDGTRGRLREKVAVFLQCTELCAMLDAISALMPDSATEIACGGKLAPADKTKEMRGWQESRLAMQLGIDLSFVTERRKWYLDDVAAGQCTPLGDDASLKDGWLTRWSRRGETWTQKQASFRKHTSAENKQTQPKIDDAFLAGLDVGLSAPEATFAHQRALQKKKAAGKAHTVADDAGLWMTGDIVWEIIPGCELMKAANAAGMPLRASCSGTTFNICLCARYLGMTGPKMQLVKLACLAFLVPQHHSFLEVMLGSSEFCGVGTLEAGVDCWSSLLPPDFSFAVPSSATVTRESLNAEIEKEMQGTGDIKAELLAKSGTEYAHNFQKYRKVWPKYWLSVEHQKELAAEYDALAEKPAA